MEENKEELDKSESKNDISEPSIKLENSEVKNDSTSTAATTPTTSKKPNRIRKRKPKVKREENSNQLKHKKVVRDKNAPAYPKTGEFSHRKLHRSIE